MRLLIILLIPLIVSMLLSSIAPYDFREDALKMRSEYANKVAKEKKLSVSGSGQGYSDAVEELIISFDSKTLLTLPEARKLYVEIVEGFIQKVNSNKNIRPFLLEYPFTADNASIKLSFIDKNHPKGCTFSPYITYISVVNGEVDYSIYDMETEMLDTLHSEPYKVALEIVKSEGNK